MAQMTDAANLERGYRRWLRWYPGSFRREHESEILGVLMAGAREGQRRPEPMECLDLVGSALCMRLRPRVPRSDRSAFNAIKLMYAGAVVELSVAITVLATIGDVRSNVVKVNPGLTEGEWHAVVTGQLEPTAVAACISVGFWLLMAWSIGRGHRWARVAFAIFFGLNTFSLLHGLAGGSAEYARPDLAVAIVLWLVELAAAALILHMETSRSQAAVEAAEADPAFANRGRGG
jgi:hypothetical protein